MNTTDALQALILADSTRHFSIGHVISDTNVGEGQRIQTEAWEIFWSPFGTQNLVKDRLLKDAVTKAVDRLRAEAREKQPN